MIFLNL